MSTISVVVTTFNSGRRIGGCLASVKWADEIIVVDGGSSDETLEVVSQFTDKIYNQPNHEMLNINKNYGFKKATSDWILSLDSDERISDGLRDEILALLSASCIECIEAKPPIVPRLSLDLSLDTARYDGFWIPRKNILFGKHLKRGVFHPDRQLRLFRRGSGKFDCGDVHEYLRLDGKAGRLSGEIVHYGASSVAEYLQKVERYSNFRARRYYEEGRPFKLSKMVLGPLRLFLISYIKRRGFLDGFEGFLANVLYSFNSFLDHVKLWETWRKGEAGRSGPLQILMVAGIFGIKSSGGRERWIEETATGLTSRGHKVVILAGVDRNDVARHCEPAVGGRSNPRLQFEIASSVASLPPRNDDRSVHPDGVEWIWYRVSRKTRLSFYISTVFNSWRAASATLRKRSFHVVNFHDPLSTFGAVLRSSMRRTFKVYTYHDPVEEEYRLRHRWRVRAMGAIGRTMENFMAKFVPRILNYIEKENLAKCDRIVTLSEFYKRRLTEVHDKIETKLKVIPGGVDPGVFAETRDSGEALKRKLLAEDSNTSIVGFVGRLVPEKGYSTLLAAACKVIAQVENVKFLIIGDGPLKPELEAEAARLGINGKVQFLGWVEDPARYISGLDVFVSPSLREGFGLAILEAMAAGKPVVAADVGAVPELIIDGENGFLMPPDDPQTLADKILFLLKNKELARRMGESAKERAKCFSWDESVDKLESLYRG